MFHENPLEDKIKQGIEHELEKPPLLYHGSPHKNIQELQPKRKTVRDPEEGEVLFATQDLAFATLFMIPLRGLTCGRFNKIPYVCIESSKEEFIRNDTGGHVYVVPSDSFSCDSHKGLSKYEWTSKNPVKPVAKIEYPSTLDALIENGVQVYFVDTSTLQQIREAPDHGHSILKNTESENKFRNKNIVEI